MLPAVRDFLTAMCIGWMTDAYGVSGSARIVHAFIHGWRGLFVASSQSSVESLNRVVCWPLASTRGEWCVLTELTVWELLTALPAARRLGEGYSASDAKGPQLGCKLLVWQVIALSARRDCEKKCLAASKGLRSRRSA